MGQPWVNGEPNQRHITSAINVLRFHEKCSIRGGANAKLLSDAAELLEWFQIRWAREDAQLEREKAIARDREYKARKKANATSV